MSEAAADAARGGLFRRIGLATANYGVGQVLPQAVGFLLIPVFTAYLSPTDYGVLELASVFGSVVMLAMRFGMPGAVTRFYFDTGEGAQLRTYVTSIFWFTVLSSLVIGTAALAFMAWRGEWVAPGVPVMPVIALVVATAFLAGSVDLQRRLIQAREQSRYSAVLSVVTALITSALSVSFVVGLGLGATGVVLGEALGALVFFAQAIWYLWPELKGRISAEALKASWSYAAGVLPAHAVGVLGTFATRSILAHVDSAAAVGLLALAARFMKPLNVLALAFSSAYLPVYFSVRKSETPDALERLANTTATVWTIAVGGTLTVALLGPPAIVLVTPERFHPAEALLPILALGFLGQTLYTLASAEVFYSKKTWIAPLVAAASVAVSVGTTIVAAPRWGAMGVAVALAASSFTNAAAAHFAARQLVRIPHRFGTLAAASGAGIVAFAVPNLLVDASSVASLPIDGLAVGLYCVAAVALLRRPRSTA